MLRLLKWYQKHIFGHVIRQLQNVSEAETDMQRNTIMRMEPNSSWEDPILPKEVLSWVS